MGAGQARGGCKVSHFLSMCMEDFASLKLSQGAFQEQVCARCRNGKCSLSPWSDDIFARRVREQPNRFFNPERADPGSSRYEHLRDFESLLHRAMQLEIADRKGDWSIPEISVLDGRIGSETRTDTMLEEAVRATLPAAPTEPSTEQPSTEEEEPLGTPDITGTPSLNTHSKAMPTPPLGNTTVPAQGLMVGGEEPTQPVSDPWAPKPLTKVRAPGARIRFGLTGVIDE
jgi:hypothetical protein